MSTFYLLQISVKDPDKLKIYTDAGPDTVVSFGGELVFRGKVSDTISGQPGHESAVVLKFPDPESAKGGYESKDYQSLIDNRNAAADVVVTRYDEPDFFKGPEKTYDFASSGDFLFPEEVAITGCAVPQAATNPLSSTTRDSSLVSML